MFKWQWCTANCRTHFKQSLEVGLYQSITNGAVWSFFSAYPVAEILPALPHLILIIWSQYITSLRYNERIWILRYILGSGWWVGRKRRWRNKTTAKSLGPESESGPRLFWSIHMFVRRQAVSYNRQIRTQKSWPVFYFFWEVWSFLY